VTVTGDDADAEATSASGPLSTVLALIAVGLLAVVGLRRRT